jgi:hypothetical protein
MLCGSVPFFGTTAASVMMMHLVNPVPQIFEKNNTLPVGIQAVLDTAMAKKPDDRFQTAGEFAKAIQAVTTGVHRQPSIQSVTPIPTQRSTTTPTPTPPPPITNESDAKVGAPGINPVQSNHIKTPLPEMIPVVQKPAGTEVGSARAPSDVHPRTPRSHPNPLLKRLLFLPLWGWIVSLTVILVLSLMLFLWSQGIFPFAALPESIGNPNGTTTQNSPAPPSTGIASSQSLTFLGQADKLAFVKSSDIWVSDLDGSNLAQLTTDGVKKSHLHWSPDGQSVIYTTTNCINLVGLQTFQEITLTCFTGVPSITAFDISPDGSMVALGLAETSLYLLPYAQLFSLRQTSLPDEILPLAQCSYYAPYNTGHALKAVNWSHTNNRLALLQTALIDGSYRDQVNILDFTQCTATPLLVKEILPTYFLFTLRGYFDHPEISSLSWNGNDQLLFTGYINNEGFGDLQLYDLNQNQGQALTPNGDCCYRDAHWSPDGSYLLYSYQSGVDGEVSLFYTPASKLSQPDRSMASLALPAGFLTGNMESLQPALRAVH